MNALLQHRGANLMGAAARSQCRTSTSRPASSASARFYTGMTRFGLTAFTSIALFGVLVAGTMALIRRWHKSSSHPHRGEVEHLLAIARRDKH
jgi:hypothetical protein